ncbi:MAG TPA: hypothetical protein PKY46_14280 [Ignavibacteriaceae bacterium]|nr:hypothetical protein [Ignavibacteriaceae bacterium]
MSNITFNLPDILLLSDYNGNFDLFTDAVYSVFFKDFVKDKTFFRGEKLKLKWHPLYQNKAYTFYHMTHKGKDEQNRVPDLRRCERIPWAKPTIEHCDTWKLKIWPQQRSGQGGLKDRLCIWLEMDNEPDYIVILDIREKYKLLWTAFVLEYPHEKRKRKKEYEAWFKTQKSPGKT